jgi:hypothetical protein
MGMKMNNAISQAAILIPLLACALSQAQQQTKTWETDPGHKETLDLDSGLTEVWKDGQTQKISPAQINEICETMEKNPELAGSSAWTSGSVLCERWGEIQAKTQIERVPFLNLITRLLVVTPPSTDFARYRGMEVKSDASATAYDSIIVPSDIGNSISCSIREGIMPDRMAYIYMCDIQTSSFQNAIELKDHLLHLLGSLNLSEDQVREHGMAVRASEEGRCAPTGECEGAHTFVTAENQGKVLEIDANPDFTRNVDALALSLKSDHDIISGVSANSASVRIAVMSVGPKKANNVTEGKPNSQSSPQ